MKSDGVLLCSALLGNKAYAGESGSDGCLPPKKEV